MLVPSEERLSLAEIQESSIAGRLKERPGVPTWPALYNNMVGVFCLPQRCNQCSVYGTAKIS